MANKRRVPLPASPPRRVAPSNIDAVCRCWRAQLVSPPHRHLPRGRHKLQKRPPDLWRNAEALDLIQITGGVLHGVPIHRNGDEEVASHFVEQPPRFLLLRLKSEGADGPRDKARRIQTDYEKRISTE